MGAPITVIFGTYNFPNRTFELNGLPAEMVLDETKLPRKKGSSILASKVGPRTIRIEGQLHGPNVDSVHSSLDQFMATLVENAEQNLYYRSDRYAKAWLKSFGHSYKEGAYQVEGNDPVVADVKLVFQMADPYLYSTSVTGLSQVLSSLVNGSYVFGVPTVSFVPSVPVIRFVAAGATVTDALLLQNQINGDRFQWHGVIPPFGILTVDCEAKTVTLNGADGLSQFDGDFMELAGLTNLLRYAGTAMNFMDITYRRRYLV